MSAIRILNKWRSLFPFCHVHLISTNHNCSQKADIRSYNRAARPPSTSQNTAARSMTKNADVTSGRFEEGEKSVVKRRNFFEGEQTNSRDTPMMSVEQFEKTCQLLMNKDRSKANIVTLKSLYRLPAASLNYEKSQFFVEHVLMCWWRTFSRHLELQTLNQPHGSFFTGSQLAVILNSLTKLHIETEGKIVQQLGWQRLQLLTDAVFESSTGLPYRSVAMILRNVYTLITRYKDQEQFPPTDSTVTAWSNVKLRRFMLNFYHSLQHYDPNTDPMSYLNIEEALLVVFFASKLGLESPCNKNLPNSEEICGILAKLFTEFSSPNFWSDSPMARLIQLTKFMQICVDWQFDVELYGPDGKKNAAVWSNIFEQVAALLNRTAAASRSDQSRAVFRTKVCKLALIAACKFGRERQFAVHMRTAWSEIMGPKTMNGKDLASLMDHVKQSPNCQNAAQKYSDFGCYQKLFEVLLQ